MSKTKKSLVLSCLSMLLCLTMLIGSTFAWFTDNASTGVNTIRAGTLDIELQMKDANGRWVSAEGKTLDFVKAPEAENEAILWEPGCTYELPELRLVNNSNLALKYKVLISGIKGDAMLNEAIDWTIQLGGQDLAIGEEMHWLPTVDTTKAFTISGSMKEDAGNEYQGLSIEGISITVVATQDTVEHDSNGNQYDAGAEYPDPVVVSEPTNDAFAAAVASVENGGTVVLPAGNYNIPANAKHKTLTITGTEDTKIECVKAGEGDYGLDGATVTFEGVTLNFGEQDFNGYVRAKATYIDCTINGRITLGGESTFTNCTFNNMEGYNVWTWGSNATFENCTFNCGGKSVLVYGGSTSTVTINRCTFNDLGGFDGKAAIETGSSYGESFTININSVTVNGFAVNPEGISTNSTIWANKNSMPKDRLNVVIDGVDVY